MLLLIPCFPPSFTGERPFKCKYCKMSFTTNGNMHRHMRIHTKEAELNALGVKVQKRRSPASKFRNLNFVPIEPAPPKSPVPSANLPPGLNLSSTPLNPLTTLDRTPESKMFFNQTISPRSMPPLDGMKKTNFVNYTPDQMLLPRKPVSTGAKRTFNFVNYAPEGVVPNKKSKIQEIISKESEALNLKQSVNMMPSMEPQSVNIMPRMEPQIERSVPMEAEHVPEAENFTQLKVSSLTIGSV